MANQLAAKTDGDPVQTTPTQREVTRNTVFTPRVDILERDDELLMIADMAGVRAEDVDIRFEHGELTIHGHCACRQPENGYWLSEYEVGDFYRAFSIREDINADKISAELKNGILTVHLPKSEKVQPKKIAVMGN
jgi:HSP20 family protein